MRPFSCLPPALLALVATLIVPSVVGEKHERLAPLVSQIAQLPDYVHKRLDNLSPQEQRAHHAEVAASHAAIETRLATQAPVGVRKMSDDPSEKFFPEYWIFDEQDSRQDGLRKSKRGHLEKAGLNERSLNTRSRESGSANMTYTELFPALQLHYNAFNHPVSPRDLQKRGYQCPTGYHSCLNIGNSGTCCKSDQTCQGIVDSGIGTVGCCPSGETCSGSVGTCDAFQGYTSCPTYQNPDGCCSPGFECDNVGCM